MQEIGPDHPTQRWHSETADHAIKLLNASQNGLSQQEAESRLSVYGLNHLPEPPKKSGLVRFIMHFNHILVYVLLGSAVITGLLAHWVVTFVILAVIIANALIGFIQEGKAEMAMDSIRQMLAPHATVFRDDSRVSIEGQKIVSGDIVLLEAGDKIPADIRLLQTWGLQIQEAILTGESVPVEKQVKPVVPKASLGDRSCMAFSGTLVTSGQGKGVVVATGSATEIGRISSMLSEVDTLTTPLVTQMGLFAKWLTFFILTIAAMILAFGYFVQHYEFADLFMAVVGLSVAAIPEGLPAVLTITLAVGVNAMAKRNAIVRRLPAIETLGSVSVICTDKTGTLTQNEMMVTSVMTSDHRFKLEGEGYNPFGVIMLKEQTIDPIDYPVLRKLALAATLCNDATLQNRDGSWEVEGNPMEAALLAFSGKTAIDFHKEQRSWPRTDAIPFDAKHRFMATLNHDHENHAFIFVKGAPEQILSMCHKQLIAEGKEEPLNEGYWKEEAYAVTALGQRVLAFAIKPVLQKHTVLVFSDVENSLILLGMVGMIDPPRPESINAVEECHNAGIRVKMITGDHVGTAVAIGRHIGLKNLNRVLSGNELDAMDDYALKQIVMETDIFARTSPEHKLRLVMALQSLGLTVAMTGDGVNDAPALKRADAGIAMGKKGSESAKEASELVLADDHFTSIVAAVREGRTVYDNIKKVISWTLPTNAGEAMTIIIALLFGMTLPITPVQILWVNLITAATLGLALAFEPTEENTMHRPPRPRGEALLTGGLVWHIVLVSTLFLCGIFGMYTYAIDQGYSMELARSIYVNTLVVMEIFHLFFIRNIYSTSLTWKMVRGTPAIWMVVTIIIVAQFAFTYLPVLQGIFGTESISFHDGLIIVGVGIALFTIIETEKQIRLHLRKLRRR